MIADRMFLMLGLMMLVPIIMILINADPTTGTIVTMGANLGILFFLRRTFKTGITGMFATKVKWQCMICQGNKFDKKGFCFKCGRSQRRPV